MKRLFALIISTFLMAGGLIGGLTTPAAAAATDTVTINVNMGSGHVYTGDYDACTGDFAVSGTTQGALHVYTETVTGNFNSITKTLNFESVYTPVDGVVFDGTYNSAYSYAFSGTVADSGWATGSLLITKTPVGGTPVVEGPWAVEVGDMLFMLGDNGGTCTPPPALEGNHGEYVSGAAKAGVKGAALALIAKDKTKVGPYPGS